MENEYEKEYEIVAQYDSNWIICYNLYSGIMRRIKAINYEKRDHGISDYRNATSGLLKMDCSTSKEKLFLTIVPTFQCNFRCEYCWESFSNEKITEKTRDGICKLIDEKKDNIKEIEISWFGGEALLDINTIELLSKQVKMICEENRIKFSQRIATNGYLFTLQNQKKLKSYNFKNAVITIDGCGEIHNSRRHLKDGGETFERIVKNIEQSIFDDKLDLGVNVDFTNIDGIQDLLKQLNCVKDKIIIYFRWVFPKVEKWKEYYNSVEYERNNKIIHKRIVELNWLAVKAGFEIRNPLFNNKRGYCKSDYENHYIIGPEGAIYKCNVEMDSKFRYGLLNKAGEIKLNEDYYNNWRNIYTAKTEKCRRCIFLPTCSGGCSYVYMVTNKNKCALISMEEAEEYIKMKYYSITNGVKQN